MAGGRGGLELLFSRHPFFFLLSFPFFLFFSCLSVILSSFRFFFVSRSSLYRLFACFDRVPVCSLRWYILSLRSVVRPPRAAREPAKVYAISCLFFFHGFLFLFSSPFDFEFDFDVDLFHPVLFLVGKIVTQSDVRIWWDRTKKMNA